MKPRTNDVWVLVLPDWLTLAKCWAIRTHLQNLWAGPRKCSLVLEITHTGASARLAEEKGTFPMYRPEYLKSNFIRTLPASVKQEIRKYGIRNSHLTSYAPTGTISLVADNVSGGIEPVFSHYYDRTINTPDGVITERVEDYAYLKRNCRR